MAKFKVGQKVYVIVGTVNEQSRIVKGAVYHQFNGLYSIAIPDKSKVEGAYIYTVDVHSIATNKKDINKRLLNRYKRNIREHKGYAKEHSEIAVSIQHHLDEKHGFIT